MDEVGPGQAYLPFVVMEDLLDKLKLINYDTEFTTQFKIKPISRHYFAVPTNPGEQFYIFSSLAAWLIQQSGIAFETPQESDDPNTTVSNILDVLRNMGTAIDFPPSRLKQGWGEHVIFVLDHLADKALRKKHFGWKTNHHLFTSCTLQHHLYSCTSYACFCHRKNSSRKKRWSMMLLR